MKVYLGLDIGTTNTKCLVLGSNGVILETIREATPKKKLGGAEYLDLRKMQSLIEKLLSEINEKYALGAVAFSSVGETVIPLRNRTPLCLPLMWYDRAVYPLWEKHKAAVDKLAPYKITGMDNGYIFSIYKILFQRDLFDLKSVEHWLPVGSFFAYMLGAEPTWDMSLACRSFMVDIHERSWNRPILEYVDVAPDSMGELVYTGQQIGSTKDGVPIISGGHDHITGLFAAKEFAQGKEFLFDSMGSASVVAAVVKSDADSLDFESPFMPGGTIGIAFEESQYYIENDIRYYGRLLESLMNLTGLKASKEGYDRLNEVIERSDAWHSNPLFLVSGDLVTGEVMEGITLLDMPLTFTREELLHCAYIYLVSSSKEIVDNLEKITEKRLPIICGGGGSQNSLLMKYKASLMERDISILPTSELTALGGALAAAHGVGDSTTIERCVKNHGLLKTEADIDIAENIKDIYSRNSKRYSDIEKERKIDFQQR